MVGSSELVELVIGSGGLVVVTNVVFTDDVGGEVVASEIHQQFLQTIVRKIGNFLKQKSIYLTSLIIAR